MECVCHNGYGNFYTSQDDWEQILREEARKLNEAIRRYGSYEEAVKELKRQKAEETWRQLKEAERQSREYYARRQGQQY